MIGVAMLREMLTAALDEWAAAEAAQHNDRCFHSGGPEVCEPDRLKVIRAALAAEDDQGTPTGQGARVSAPHEPTVIRNASTGVVSVDWGGPVPPGDDLVLMTVSLFCESIDAINIERSNRASRERTR